MVQTSTRHVSVKTIMRSLAFRHGVADARSGRSPRFHVLHAWKELRDELSAGRGPIKSADDRAEARSRAVAT
jgi:hypothetical protein